MATPSVCLIGNSFLGAVRKAYESRPATGDYEFAFFAHVSPQIEQVGFDDHFIVNTPYNSGQSNDVRDYDYFVIYCDAPTLTDCGSFDRNLRGTYSENVRTASFDGWINQCHAVRILRALRAIADKPIFLLSRNINRRDNVGLRADNDVGLALIQSFISPSEYIQFPDTLLAEDGHPDAAYYQGSLNVVGEEPDREIQPLHHYGHLNAAGGARMLGQIVASLDAYRSRSLIKESVE